MLRKSRTASYLAMRHFWHDAGRTNKKHLKNVGPIRHNEPPHAHSADVASGAVLSRAACASMSTTTPTTTTTTTTRDRVDRYGPMEWAQRVAQVQNDNTFVGDAGNEELVENARNKVHHCHTHRPQLTSQNLTYYTVKITTSLHRVSLIRFQKHHYIISIWL